MRTNVAVASRTRIEDDLIRRIGVLVLLQPPKDGTTVAIEALLPKCFLPPDVIRGTSEAGEAMHYWRAWFSKIEPSLIRCSKIQKLVSLPIKHISTFRREIVSCGSQFANRAVGTPSGASSSIPGHPSNRRDHVPRKITVQSGAKRHPKDAEAAGRSALDDDLGSAQDWSAGRMAIPRRFARRA